MAKVNIKRILKWTGGVVLFLFLLSAATYYFFLYDPPSISAEDRAEITIMPLPAELALRNGMLDLAEGIHPVFPKGDDKLILGALEHWTSSAGLEIHEAGVPVVINITNGVDEYLPGTPESYSLEISSNSIEISAESSIGALRAIETIRQLSAGYEWTSVRKAIVKDQPLYPWRGLMVDVSRHFIPAEVIFRLLESMSAVKMNVFHWHLSDDQGFRVESKRYPRLHEVGANGSYYTQEQIKEIIEFARVRGIRVVPEFDLPGHSKSWQMAYPVLSSISEEQSFGMKGGIAFTSPIDPTREEVYVFLDSLIDEMASLFPDPDFHIGADEVNSTAWDNNPDIQDFMRQQGMKDAHDLQTYFVMRMQEILKKHGKRMIGWDEILNPELDSAIVVQAWTGHKALFEAVQQGSSGILSAGLYLDHILSAGDHYKVDPRVLPGAVEIVPDSTYWKMYDQQMKIGDNVMESQIVIFDRDPNNVYGYMAMLSDRTAFENGTIVDNVLKFNMMGPVGELSYEASLQGDSLVGEIGFGLLSFESNGYRSGGSDISGSEMPHIEVMRPLTPAEESLILGGEACQWAEFVDSENIESRIWPRTAAIAEKLWSPTSLTSDVDDMYRRLGSLSTYLETRGSAHKTQLDEKLSSFIHKDGFAALKTLTNTLEEVKYHGRIPDLMSMPYVYLPEYSLNRIVDAVQPESATAREFNLLVDKYIENGDLSDKGALLSQLNTWANNHEKLTFYFRDSGTLQEVETISRSLANISSELSLKLSNADRPINSDSLSWAVVENGENGVIIAVLPGLKKLKEL